LAKVAVDNWQWCWRTGSLNDCLRCWEPQFHAVSIKKIVPKKNNF